MNSSAAFITPSFRQPGEVAAPSPYLRREFTVAPGLRRATLHATALGLIEAYANGTRVGDEVLAPGWTSYRHRLVVSSHDITDLLVPGTNALGAILGDGWAVGRLSWEADNRNLWADRPAAFLQLELDYGDPNPGDRTEIVITDTSWRAATGAVLSGSIYDGESYDARLEPAGWARAGFDDSGWAGVDVVEWDLGALIDPPAPPIRRIEELRPVEIVTTATGKTVVDFGQNVSGWVRLNVAGEAGTTITLRHTEAFIAGEADFTPNRTAEATDRYTLRGGGVETWEPRFTFHGFRYVEVDGWPGELTADAITAVVIHTDMTRTGWFETSSEPVNHLHRNVVWSMRGNFVGVPTDCPQRDERLGWTGDLNAFAPTAAFLYDVASMLGSWLQDLAAEQRETGSVPLVVPNCLGHNLGPTALWGDVAVSLPWTLYQEYGDRELLARQYSSMAAFIDSVEPLLDGTGLWSSGFQFGDWVDPDAPPDNPAGGKTDPHLVGAAYLCKTTREMARTAELLDRPQDAARYSALHERVRAAFRHEWVTPAGLLANETATAYSLAICFDIFDPAQEARAGQRLADVVAKAGYRISTGFAGTPLVCHALSRTGQLRTAYRLLLQTECPSFLYPLSKGATTIWERWDAIRPDGSFNDTGMTSLNHYALGAVADWLHKVVGGLSPAEPGYRRMRIAPQPGGGLTWATTRHDTPHGRVQVRWERAGGRARVEVTIPDGTAAEVVLPDHPEGFIAQVAGGSHRWEYTVPVKERPAYTLETPVQTLVADTEAWEAVWAVFTKHVPQAATSSSGASGFDGSLRDMVQLIPGQATALEAELAQTLEQLPGS